MTRPGPLLIALTLAGCHEDSTHADLAPGDRLPPSCAELRQIEPCPDNGRVARQWLPPELPPADAIGEIWTYDDPNPIVGWDLVVELCADDPEQPTSIESSSRYLLWYADDAFSRIDNIWYRPRAYTRTTCRPESSAAIERVTIIDGRYRIETWAPRP